MPFKNLILLMVVVFFDVRSVFAHSILMPKGMPTSYNAECGSCHMAYPPGLLSRKSWQNIMQTIANHFGTDASIDSKNRDEITTWLIKNAASQSQFNESGIQNRITTTAWFKSEHVKIKPEVWKRSSVRSRSNCGACHMEADGGIFHDTNVKIP